MHITVPKVGLGRLAALFTVDRRRFDLRHGLAIVVVLFLPFVLLGALHQQSYWLSVSFGALVVGLSDPGGPSPYRIRRMTLVSAVGAMLTGLAFGLDGAWEWAVPATFVVTLLAGLAVRSGERSLVVSSTLLNLWFVVAGALTVSFRLDHTRTHGWIQLLAWLAGAALMMAGTAVLRLLRGHHSRPDDHAAPEPGAAVPTTRQTIGFATARAVAVTLAVAVAFGIHLPYTEWMPISTLSALKPGLQQTTLMAAQRVAGTVVGAGVAAALLVTVDVRPALGALLVIFGGLAGAVRAMSYTWFVAATAGAILIAVDLPHPSDLTAEGLRILFTFIGVAIAVAVLLLGALLTRSSAGSRATPAARDD